MSARTSEKTHTRSARNRLFALAAAAAAATAATLTAAAPASADVSETATLGDLEAYMVTWCEQPGTQEMSLTASGADLTSYTEVTLGITKDGSTGYLTFALPADYPLVALNIATFVPGETTWQYRAEVEAKKLDGTYDRIQWSGAGNCTAPESTSSTTVTDTRQSCDGNEQRTSTTAETWSRPNGYYWLREVSTVDDGWSVVSKLDKPDAKALGCAPYGGLVKPGKK